MRLAYMKDIRRRSEVGWVNQGIVWLVVFFD